MNKKIRERVKTAIDYLQKASEISEGCRDHEYDAMTNIEGTSLENTSRYEAIEKSCSYLEEAIDDIESAIDNLSASIE